MRACIVLLFAGLLLMPQVAFGERCRAIDVVKEQELDGHSLSLDLVYGDGRIAKSDRGSPPVLPIGSSVDLCFESSLDGFVSLWSHDANNNPPIRILPNDYLRAEAGEPGVRIRAGVPTCFSDLVAALGISLAVGPPTGLAEIYLHFAESSEGQIGPEDFPTIGNKGFNLGSSCDSARAREAPRPQTEPYASMTLAYEVVE